jgi:hypothetical protein
LIDQIIDQNIVQRGGSHGGCLLSAQEREIGKSEDRDRESEKKKRADKETEFYYML